MNDPIELSETLNSKLCHDLAGPISAVENSAELVDSADTIIREKAIKLIKHSSKELVSWLKFYRYAYGTSYSNEPTAIGDIHNLIKSVIATLEGRVSLTFKSKIDSVTTTLGKIITCMFVTAFHTCKTREVDIDISEKQIILTLKGKQFHLHSKKFNILRGDSTTSPLNVRNVHEHYLYSLSKQIDCTFVIDQFDELSIFKIIL